MLIFLIRNHPCSGIDYYYLCNVCLPYDLVKQVFPHVLNFVFRSEFSLCKIHSLFKTLVDDVTNLRYPEKENNQTKRVVLTGSLKGGTRV